MPEYGSGANGYGSHLPDEIIARTDLSAEAKVLCHELDKYRNCDPRSEQYLQWNPGNFTLQKKCGFRSITQVERIIRELEEKGLVKLQPGEEAKYVLSWPTPAENEQRQREDLLAKLREEQIVEQETQRLAEISEKLEREAQFEDYPIESVIAGDEKAKDWVIDDAYLQAYFEIEGEAKYQRAIELRNKPQLDENAEKLRRRTVKEKYESAKEEKLETPRFSTGEEGAKYQKLEEEERKWNEEYKWETRFQKQKKREEVSGRVGGAY